MGALPHHPEPKSPALAPASPWQKFAIQQKREKIEPQIFAKNTIC
jgi:hypothetical protein